MFISWFIVSHLFYWLSNSYFLVPVGLTIFYTEYSPVCRRFTILQTVQQQPTFRNCKVLIQIYLSNEEIQCNLSPWKLYMCCYFRIIYACIIIPR